MTAVTTGVLSWTGRRSCRRTQTKHSFRQDAATVLSSPAAGPRCDVAEPRAPMQPPPKRTKIVATVGPGVARSGDAALAVPGRRQRRAAELLARHARRARRDHRRRAPHRARARACTSRSCKICPGPKVRTGAFADGTASVRLQTGAPFTLTTEQVAGDARARERLVRRARARRRGRQARLPRRRRDRAARDRRRRPARADRRRDRRRAAREAGDQLPRRHARPRRGHRPRPRAPRLRHRAGRRLGRGLVRAHRRRRLAREVAHRRGRRDRSR